jgi:hypothetical protein
VPARAATVPQSQRTADHHHAWIEDIDRVRDADAEALSLQTREVAKHRSRRPKYGDDGFSVRAGRLLMRNLNRLATGLLPEAT